MAKELPYFQFEPAEYLTKDISFCSLSAQGLFINICCFYWQRQCVLNKEQFLRRFNYLSEFEELIKEGVIDIQNEYIVIKFLDKQYLKATEKSSTNSANGKKGGRPEKRNKSETKANKKPNESEVKGIREEEIIEYEIKKDDNNQKKEEHAHKTFEQNVIYTSSEIEIQEERKVAPKESENSVVIYPVEEIEHRFKNWEYELWEGAMKNYKITKEEYKKGVDMFLFEQGHEKLKRDYGENMRHFKSWLKLNVKHIKNQKNGQTFAGVSSSSIEQTFNAFKKKPTTKEN